MGLQINKNYEVNIARIDLLQNVLYMKKKSAFGFRTFALFLLLVFFIFLWEFVRWWLVQPIITFCERMSWAVTISGVTEQLPDKYNGYYRLGHCGIFICPHTITLLRGCGLWAMG